MTKQEFVQHYLTRFQNEIAAPIVQSFVFDLMNINSKMIQRLYPAMVDLARHKLRKAMNEAMHGPTKWLPWIDDATIMATLVSFGVNEAETILLPASADQIVAGAAQLQISLNIELIKKALESEFDDRYGTFDTSNVLLLRRQR